MSKHAQQGATIVEFSLTLIVLLTLLLGILDFSRMLWTWNAANEATRWGARTAVVCSQGSPGVLRRMQIYLPQLTSDNLEINWFDELGQVSTSCDGDTCSAVEVRIRDLSYQWISPVGFSTYGAIGMPGFSTYLPRESMGWDPDSASLCN